MRPVGLVCSRHRGMRLKRRPTAEKFLVPTASDERQVITMTGGPTDEARLDALDGWRGVSILLILACHLLPLGPKSLQLNDMAGPMGMAIFFTLSGFLITRFLLHRPIVKRLPDSTLLPNRPARLAGHAGCLADDRWHSGRLRFQPAVSFQSASTAPSRRRGPSVESVRRNAVLYWHRTARAPFRRSWFLLGAPVLHRGDSPSGL